MYLLFKDHKGWSLETGTPPPSRPVVSAGAGQNDHMSEIISNILEPIVKTWKGSMEMESTGDLVSIVNVDINEKKVVVEEEVDLELVDEHMKEKELEIDERYNNFDKYDHDIPDGWKEEERLRSEDNNICKDTLPREMVTLSEDEDDTEVEDIPSGGSRLDTTLTVPVGEREDDMLSKLDKNLPKKQ